MLGALVVTITAVHRGAIFNNLLLFLPQVLHM